MAPPQPTAVALPARPPRPCERESCSLEQSSAEEILNLEN